MKALLMQDDDRLAVLLRERDEARALLREVDRLLRDDMGGWYISAPHSDPLGIIREDIRAALEGRDG